MADMFSSSPQERPAESVSKKKPSPQMVPCNISSARRQMSPGEGKLQGSLDRRKKRRGKKKKKKERKKVSQFSLGYSLNRASGCYCINFT